ncbi:MAG: hypothetical protein HXX15_10645 [Rhodopseudomonas sp.]|uniref:hypothetical protein n=1 Tax=Rhodopseudomonas sp. TaxID=1078 RepID=UPI001825DF1B|nr:hypothetical protein [Rhodopseudomonas sp.]NVN86533.1 hypothetical protein [Rhodopseudomonas sp.]
MLQSLLSAIVETLVTATGHAILKFLGWDQAAEFVGAVVGLACIATGFAIWWLGS